MSDIRKWYRSYKNTLSCTQCNEDHAATLEFHHVYPGKKSFGISEAAKHAKNWQDIKRIRKELRKCIVLCSNCHKKVHWNMRQNQR